MHATPSFAKAATEYLKLWRDKILGQITQVHILHENSLSFSSRSDKPFKYVTNFTVCCKSTLSMEIYATHQLKIYSADNLIGWIADHSTKIMASETILNM